MRRTDAYSPFPIHGLAHALGLHKSRVAMLVLASCTALAALLYSLARWHRGGVHFHPLLQLQLAGLNGAFLTGDP